MTDPTFNSRQLSIKINEVLDHLGVNDEIRSCRRNCFFQMKYFEDVSSLPLDDSIVWSPYDSYIFGSQVEGTTTLGLKSDMDKVSICNNVIVITDNEDDNVSVGMYTFLMDKFTNKGYCCLRDISFYKETYFVKYWKGYFTEKYRRENYLKNLLENLVTIPGIKIEMEGPAVYCQINGLDVNYLNGIYCSSWPREVSNTFLLNQEKLYWPSDQLLQDVLQTRCFVVPKGSDTGPDSDIEWRLSFSFGERLLMFDLNIVQIRCYVLMKYIKTTFLDNVQDCKGIISSYICKTVLFHTVSQTNKSEWVEEKLLLDLNRCLSNLQKFIDQKNCPHFIMPLNNLLENKLNSTTRVRLLDELKKIIESNGCVLFDIKIDNFGDLLRGKGILNNIEHGEKICCRLLIPLTGAFKLLNEETVQLNESLRACETQMTVLHKLHQCTPVSNKIKQNAVIICGCAYGTLIGSLLASDDIKYSNGLSDKAFHWFLLGMMCSDTASAHLKLASILFQIGDFVSTDILLNDSIKKLDETVLSLCTCKGNLTSWFLSQDISIQRVLKKSHADMIRENITSCVKYSLREINCCPKELQYEFFRAIFDKEQQTTELGFKWYICAIIPQIPFIKFLEYKLYKELGMMEECYIKLFELADITNYWELYMNHLETIYNLIGQCMEQEGYYIVALHYYYKSLQVEPTYNAAKILICCNLCQQLDREKSHKLALMSRTSLIV